MNTQIFSRENSYSDATQPLQDSDILEKVAVCDMLGMKKRCLEGLVLRGEFPPPVQLGRKVYWSRRSVELWRTRKFSQQECWVPGR